MCALQTLLFVQVKLARSALSIQLGSSPNAASSRCLLSILNHSSVGLLFLFLSCSTTIPTWPFQWIPCIFPCLTLALLVPHWSFTHYLMLVPTLTPPLSSHQLHAVPNVIMSAWGAGSGDWCSLSPQMAPLVTSSLFILFPVHFSDVWVRRAELEVLTLPLQGWLTLFMLILRLLLVLSLQ